MTELSPKAIVAKKACQCPHCEESFNTSTYLVEHVRQYHPVTIAPDDVVNICIAEGCYGLSCWAFNKFRPCSVEGREEANRLAAAVARGENIETRDN